MGSRWPINGQSARAVDPSGQSSVANVPNVSSGSASTSDRPNITYITSTFRRPPNAVQTATARSHLSNSVSASSAPSQASRSPFGAQPPVQRPQAVPPSLLQPYSQHQAQVQAPGALHGPGVAGPVYGHGGGQDFSAYRLPSESNAQPDFIFAITKILESQSQKTAEALLPQFSSLHADVNSLKTSFNQVREDVSKIREDVTKTSVDVQTISEDQKRSDTATGKALRDFAEKAETLKAFLGETRLSYENGDERTTVMGRLDDMYSALCEVIEKMADREADLLENDSIESVEATPGPSHRNQAPTPSTDVDMADTEHPAASTSIQMIEEPFNATSNGTSASKPPGTTNSDHNDTDLEPVGGSAPSILSDLLEAVSKVRQVQGGEERSSTPINPLPQETAVNANTRVDIYTRTSPIISRNLSNAQSDPQGTPQTRLSSLAIEQHNVPQQQQQQQQPPTPISPVAFTITHPNHIHPLDPSRSVTSITHSFPLNQLSHSLLDLNAAEVDLASSPAMSGGLLPELGYPTREPTVVPDSDDVDVDVEGHDDGILGEGEDEVEKVGEERDSSDDEDIDEDRSMRIEGEQSVADEVPGGGAELGLTPDPEPEPGFEPEVGVEQEVEAEMEDVQEHDLIGESIEETANEEVEEVEEQDLIQPDGEDHVRLDESLRLQLEEGASTSDLLSGNKEVTPIFGTMNSVVSGDASTSQGLAGQGEREVSVARKSKEPLFLPESRTGTMSPFRHGIGPDDGIKEEQEEETQSGQREQVEDGNEEEEEQETSEHLLLSPVIEPFTPVTTRGTFPVPFAPPSSPQPQRQPSSEPSEDHASSSASPSPPPTSPITVRIIDVSQLIPSQSLPPQSSPCLSYADFPIEPDATSTPLATHTVASASPEEAAHILAQLMTLSEPSSSEEEESEEEEEEEEQVDELLPSESHFSPPPSSKYQHQRKGLAQREGETDDVQETFTTVNTVTAESSIRTFTPQKMRPGGDDSIQSFGTVIPSPIRQTARKQTGGRDPRGERKVSPVLSERVDEGNQERLRVESTAVQPEPGSHQESGSPPPHPPSSPEPAPLITIDPPTVPTPSVQADTRNDQNRAQRPVSPISLPDYISPLNSPSPSRSPLTMRGPRSGVGTSGGMFGRKRKLEEMRMRDGTRDPSSRNQQQQALTLVLDPQTRSAPGISQSDDMPMDVMELPLHEREVLVRNTGRREAGANTTSGGSRPASSSACINPSSRPTPNRKKNDASASSRVTESSASARKQIQREESPIYVSSTPTTPTEEKENELGIFKDKGKGRDRIDLTGSPSPPRAQVPAVTTGNVLSRSVQTPATGAKRRKLARMTASCMSTAQREKQRKREKGQKEAAEREKREAERKRKREKEKKMLPIGAEDSDDAEIIPVKSYKKPQAIVDGDESGNSGGQAGPTDVTPARGPKVDLSDILLRRKANEKNSKAQTKIKRKDRINAPALVNTSSSAPPLRSGNDDEPPLKRAKMRSADRDTTVAGGSKRSSRNQEERLAENGEGKKGPRSSQSRQKLGLDYAPPCSPVRISWPVKKAGSRFDKNFVECDICNTWYHYGCVGIKMGDIRLQDSEVFACPPCHSNRLRGSTSPKKDRDNCGRPDCAFKTIPDEDEYFVQRIIGKRVKIEGGRGRVEEWLVEWEGYPIGESTWERETSMANPVLLIETFVGAAEKEGWDLDEDPNATVLLKDAKRAGLSGLT